MRNSKLRSKILIISLCISMFVVFVMFLGLDIYRNRVIITSVIPEEFEMRNMKLCDYLDGVEKIILYREGDSKTFLISDEEFSLILNEFSFILENSREMPALGVSLDESTKKEMVHGDWVEFEWKETMIHNEMPFESLLINIVFDNQGFNLIRKYNDKYEGRCFYIDLINGVTLGNLSSVVSSIYV